MERLSGLDSAFLSLETPSMHLHVAIAAVIDPSTMSTPYSFEDLKAFVAHRLMREPTFRRRVVEVPFRLNHPLWVEDPHLDLDYHIRRHVLPAPGGPRELTDLTGAIVGVPLDRARPLWEIHVVEGLYDGNVALIGKIHHAAVDGVSGAELFIHLFDLTPHPPDETAAVAGSAEPAPSPGLAERIPNDIEMVGHALMSQARRVMSLPALVGRTVRTASHLRQPPPRSRGRRRRRAAAGAAHALVGGHHPAPLGGLRPRAPQRHQAGARRVRRQGQRRGAHPRVRRPAPVPHRPGRRCPGSRWSACARSRCGPRTSWAAPTTGSPPCSCTCAPTSPIPAKRLRAIAKATKGAKADHNAVGAKFIQNWAEQAAPSTFVLATRLYSRLNLADRHPPIYNVVVSNVPGPDFPLYLDGAELVATYPMGPIMEGAGLNVTVLSYLDNVDFGFLAGAELVPDVWDMADVVEGIMADLLAAADEIDPPAAAAGNGAAPAGRTEKKDSARKAGPRKGTSRKGTSGGGKASARKPAGAG